MKNLSSTPIYILLIVSISIFISHIVVMLISGDSHYPFSYQELLIDSLVLTALLFPLFYYLVFRPLLNQNTAREKIQMQVVANERKFRDLVENMNEGLIVQNNEGSITFVNNFFANIINFPKEELVGLCINDFLDEENSFILRNLLYNTDQTKIENAEIAWRVNKNHKIYTIITPSFLFDENNDIVGRFLMVSDITQRKEMELELNMAHELEKRSDRIKGEFLKLISHEIRTPINIVFGFLNLIEAKFNHSSELEGYIDTTKVGLNRLIRTIDLILNSALEISGLTKYDLKPLDIVRDVLDPVVIELRSLAQQKEIRIIAEYETHPKVFADQYCLKQIVIHLIENAIKFTNNGGNIKISIKQSLDNIILVIYDNGIGISEEYLPQLFALFSQEHQGSARKYEGNGLGLYLVKKYCEGNNLQLFVESQKGKGSTFTLMFSNYTL